MLTQVYKYRVTIGDINGTASAVVTDDLAQAERFASAMLGREWGDDREITTATIYEWDGTGYKFLSEMEF